MTTLPSVDRVLLIQLVKMGDVLLCTPAIRAARQAFPGARIDFLTDALGADVLTGNPHLDEILVYTRGARAEWGLLRKIRARRYDTVVDFHSVPRTARVVLATGATRRVGVRGRGPRNAAYTHLVPKEHGPVYIARQKLGILAPLGVNTGPDVDLALEIVIGPAERKFAHQVWEKHGLVGERPVVAISPVSHEPFKQWGAERWARMADRMAAKGARILITSGPGEREQVAAVVARMQFPAVWDYGQTTLRQLAALYERCAVWVGNDGGPKHVAVAARTPTMTVIRWQLGPIWTDLQPESPHTFLDAAPPQGCDRRCSHCSHRACLAQISPEVAAETVRSMLTARSPGRGGLRLLPLLDLHPSG